MGYEKQTEMQEERDENECKYEKKDQRGNLKRGT
jgi:hypothetical protein